jgi:hypothetical protein
MYFSKNIQTLKNLKKSFRESAKKVPPVSYTVLSLMAFAAINYSIIHSPFIILGVFVLLVHELAHYFYAKSFGADVNLPLFVPLPFIAIAFVKVKNLLDQYKPDVAIAGMVFGSLTIFIFSLMNYYTNFIPYFILFIMFIFEILFNILGFDGSKYRRYKKSSYYA